MDERKNDRSEHYSKERWDRIEKLRWEKVPYVLDQNSVVCLAYTIKELVESYVEQNKKLTVDADHSIRTCFAVCREMLKRIDGEYRAHHDKLSDFYLMNDLTSENEHLKFIPARFADDDGEDDQSDQLGLVFVRDAIKEMHRAAVNLTPDDPLKLHYQVKELQKKVTALDERVRDVRRYMLEPFVHKLVQMAGPELSEDFQIGNKKMVRVAVNTCEIANPWDEE